MTTPEQPAVPSAPAPARPAWHALHLWQIQPLRDAAMIAAVFGILWLGSKLSIVTVPVLLALLLAYLFEPLVRWLTRRAKVSRAFVALSLIVLSGLVVVVPAALGLTYGVIQGGKFADEQLSNVQALVKSVDKPQEAALRGALPSDRWRALRDWVVEQRARAAREDGTPPDGDGVQPAAENSATGSATDSATDSAKIGEAPAGAPAEQSSWPRRAVSSVLAQLTERGIEYVRANTGNIGKGAVQIGANVLHGIVNVAGTGAKIVFGAFLTGFFFFFFCTGWGKVQRFWQGLVPDARRSRVVNLVQRMDNVVAGFVRGRLTICACQIALFTIGYWIIGAPAPLILGPLVGLLTLVPYAAGLAAPVVMLMMAFDPNAPEGFRSAWWWVVGAPLVLQLMSQVLDDYVLSPMIQGKNTDLSMPLILFASISGGVLAGVYGLLVAIPVAACGKILVEELVVPRVKAWVQGREKDPLPIGRD